MKTGSYIKRVLSFTGLFKSVVKSYATNSFFILIAVILIFNSCSNTKFLSDDEKLYTYTWFNVKVKGKINNKPLKAYELYKIGKVKTNRSFIMLPRTKLLVYNYMKPSGNFGPRHYIYKVMHQPPVLLNDVNPELRAKIMKQRLTDMGHFDSNIDYDIKIYGRHDKKARAKYHITFKPAYTYRNITFVPKGRPVVDSIISTSFRNKIIKPSDDYWLLILKQEQNRITTDLKNKGYYYFKSDFLQFFADSTIGNKQVDLKMFIKDNVPEDAFKPFTIDHVSITVEPMRKRKNIREPLLINDYFYTDIDNTLKPKVISDAVSIKPGAIYNLTDHYNTIEYLQRLGVFNTINVTYSRLDSLGIDNTLAADIRLKPLKPVQTNIEANFATKSNDFMGPAAKASISHLNVFGGAENLTFEVKGGFEWQKRSKRKEYELGFNSYEIGTNLKLEIPRFITPFRIKNVSKQFVPRTYARIEYNSLKRVKFYTMNVSQVKFGYKWQSTEKHEFKVEPATIEYFHLSKKSQDFVDFLDKYPQVALSFSEQFVLGSQFDFTYSSHPKKRRLNYFYYNGNIELSGNLLQAGYSLAGQKGDPANPNTMFGTPFAQYTKIKNDFRYYIFMNEKQQIATRLVIGAGIPYNNSSVLPYAKQFFAGGSQDIRAFYARSIGPGSYVPDEHNNKGNFLDQSGEIKLLANIEYRFPITYKTSGALFADAGNVWLLNEDPSRPGGKFAMKNLFKELAVGAGMGIRFDLEYFIIRFDGAIPVHKPYLTGKKSWIFHDTSFFKDYIFSLAVGYPF